ncbi:MAG TPA: hypothetical protein VFF11_08775, partial [Candidatus Binatia bacterium]|nr:hypothetical protein [Candidatus Binatia bacterium]
MKTAEGKLYWKATRYLAIILLITVAISMAFFAINSLQTHSVQNAVEETRQSLRQQGFKTDLADFDFSTSPEDQARESVLTDTGQSLGAGTFLEHPNLMQPVSANTALVVWRQAELKSGFLIRPSNSAEFSWAEFHQEYDYDRPQIDLACDIILSNPIRFNLNASAGSPMLLRHLAPLKNLAEALGCQMVLNLHDGNQNAAWTNLLAATRLATAWKPEPAEVSHLVRFACVTLAYNDTWQALQTNHWPDDQLAQLQQEWTKADFFTNLPETAAFNRASVVAMCRQERKEPAMSLSASDWFKDALRSPRSALDELKAIWSQARYRLYGTYVDEKNLLLFYRDRELELRNAIKSPDWETMRRLPGVTNYVFFQSKYRSRLQAMLNLRELGLAAQRHGPSFLSLAAEAETRRRILITTLALERYRDRHGECPNTLAKLTPEFLQSVPVDFMDGQPLRYQLADDSHFILYSVGLDCVDNGGKMRDSKRRNLFDDGRDFMGKPREPDIVWPLPASDELVRAQRKKEEHESRLQGRSQQEHAAENEWNQSRLRQARTKNILATKWEPDARSMKFFGKQLADYIRNKKTGGTNRLALTKLLTPKQIITGGEPEELTFEVPVSYDAIADLNMASLTLMVDADPEDAMTDDFGGKIQEFDRATNGNCLLIWHTIYDPPGYHAIQIQLTAESDQGGMFCGKGPAIPVTTTNFCQFSLDSSTYDVELGAAFHARLPESNSLYTIECVTTNGEHLKTLSGTTTNGEFKVIWNLVDDHGHRLAGETFNSIVTI